MNLMFQKVLLSLMINVLKYPGDQTWSLATDKLLPKRITKGRHI